jgi:16S rRNA (cytosine967-C5)-methyltransferase
MPQAPSRAGRGTKRQGSSRQANSRQVNSRRPHSGDADTLGWRSRLAAADLIQRTTDGREDLEAALSNSKSYSDLDGPDRGYARATASAALRALGRIDWALGGLLDRPLDQLEPAVRAMLRAGCAQLWLMGSADYAVVSACVEAAARSRDLTRSGGFINAVLRRATRERQAFEAAPEASIWPDWLAAKFKATLGEARAGALARLQHSEPPIDITLKSHAEAGLWAEKLQGELLPNGTVRTKAGVRIEELPGYADGDWWVQDAGASLAATLMGDVSDRRVGDLCAAPGGKALQLAAMGANLTAIDISRQRLKMLEQNAERTKLAMDIVEADIRTWRPDELFDSLLLDAPCSALGVLRRHPEGAWRRDPSDLARFPKIQQGLVAAARDLLKPGGVLVYCVCTPNREEGEDVIEHALSQGGWRRRNISADEVPGFAFALTDKGDLMTAPPADFALEAPVAETTTDVVASASGAHATRAISSDVFYIARLERCDS